MNFLPALFTVGVVFVMLVVFRAMDRNNRSLDKVRRYADKITENIDKFVDEKTQVLKNVALELEVHQKAEKQLLTRVGGIEERLNGRAGEVEALFDRVAEYDKAVTDLVEMTRKVDENLQLLKAEETFLDSLSKRIHSSNERMDSIEKEIPGLLGSFAGKNLEQINKLWKSATKEAEKVSGKLHQELEQSRFAVNEFSDYMHQLESRRDGVEDTLINSAKEQLGILLQKTLGDFEGHADEIKGELTEAKADYRESLAGFDEEARRIRDEYRSALNKSAEVLRKHLKAGDQMVSSIKVSTEGLSDKADHVEEVIGRIREYDPEIKQLTALSSEVHENLSALRQGAGFVASTAKKLKLSEGAISAIENRIPEIEKNFAHANREALEGLSADVKRSVESTASAFMSDFEVIQDSVNEFSVMMKRLESQSDELVATAHQELESRLTALAADAAEKSGELASHFKSDLTQFSTALSGDLQQRFDRLQDEYSDIEGTIRELGERMNREATGALKEIDERSASVVMGLNQESESIADSTRQIFSQIKDRTEQLQSDFERSVKDSSDSLRENRSESDEVLRRVKGIVGELGERSDQIDNLFVRLNDYDEQMEQLAELSRETRENLARLESRKGFMTKLDGKLRRSEKSLTDIENRLPKIQSQFSEENEERFALALKQVMNSSENLAGSIRGEMKKVAEQVDEFGVYIGVLQNRRDQLGNSLLAEIEDKIHGMAQQASTAAVEEMDRHSTETFSRIEGTTADRMAEFDARVISLTDEVSRITADAGREGKLLEQHLDGRFEGIRSTLDGLKISFEESADRNDKRMEQQRASSEAVLGRLQGLVVQLSERGDEIDSICTRLNEVDGRMVQLSDMGREAGAGLEELKKQSRFVQGLSKTITKGEARLNAVEKRIPAMEEDFVQRNREHLETVYRQVSDEGAEKLQILNGEIQKASQEIESFAGELEGFEQQHRVMAQQSLEKLQTEIHQLMQKNEVRQDELLRSYKGQLEQMEVSFSEDTDSVTARFRSMADGVELRLNEADTDWQNRLIAFKRQAGDIEAQYQQNIAAVVDRAKELDDEIFAALRLEVEQRAQQTEKEMAGGIDSVRSRLEESNNELIALFGDMRSEISIQREDSAKMIAELKSGVERDMQSVGEEVRQRIVQLDEESAFARTESEKKLVLWQERSQTLLAASQQEVGNQLDDLTVKLDTAVDSMNRKVEQLNGETDRDYSRVREELQQKAAMLELKAAERLQKVELQVADFEESLSHRFNSLDQIPAGMDELELALRKYMEQEAEAVREDFIRFSHELESQREVEKRQASELFTEFRNSMTDIESSIEKIKSEAYQNVSEKLGLLEDGFFSDLKERSETMSGRMVEWQKNVAQSLEQMAGEAKRERQRVEEQYHSDLAVKLSRTQAESEKGLQELSQRVARFGDDISGKLNQAQQEVNGISAGYRKQLEGIEKASSELFEQRLKASGDEFGEKVELYQKHFDEKAASLNTLVSGSRNELDRMMEQSRSEMGQWQQQMLADLKERSGQIDTDISLLRSESTESIKTIRDHFTEQKQQVEGEHKIYLDQLKGNLDQLDRNIEQLGSRFEQRGDQLENTLAATDSALKTSLKETRGQLLELQEGLESRIADSMGRLESESTEIDRQIKAFVTQTRLFERADTLKLKLKEDIEGMKAEVAHLMAQKKELKETDKNFERIRKMESDLSGKLNGMISQKRKIEEMDRDFKHLLELSVNVETRLDRVNERSDQLQVVEARMRHLDELEGEVNQKYTRLDKKREILDATTRGVDLNFEQLSKIEERMKHVEGGFTEFLEQLKKSNERITVLANNKHDADQAVSKLSVLDKELESLEQRMDSMQKAREWLADTETRLKKIHDSSQDQMKVLGSIMKTSGREVKGAPTMDSRELVVRLARQGWTPEEITQQTGLSKGEVELILEIAPRKMK